MDSNKHTLQLACRLPLYKSSAQYLPFHYLFPVDQIKQGTDALQGSFHSWIFQCGDGWMIIFRNVLTICSCHTIILRYSFAAVNNCSAGAYRQSIWNCINTGKIHPRFQKLTGTVITILNRIDSFTWFQTNYKLLIILQSIFFQWPFIAIQMASSKTFISWSNKAILLYPQLHR